MFFVVLVCILIGFRVMDVGPMAGWSWLWLLAPFGGIVVWWLYADRSGLTAAKSMEREHKRQQGRVERNRIRLGGLDRSRRR